MLEANKCTQGVPIEEKEIVQYSAIYRYSQSLKKGIMCISKKHLHRRACSNVTTVLGLQLLQGKNKTQTTDISQTELHTSA